MVYYTLVITFLIVFDLGYRQFLENWANFLDNHQVDNFLESLLRLCIELIIILIVTGIAIIPINIFSCVVKKILPSRGEESDMAFSSVSILLHLFNFIYLFFLDLAITGQYILTLEIIILYFVFIGISALLMAVSALSTKILSTKTIFSN